MTRERARSTKLRHVYKVALVGLLIASASMVTSSSPAEAAQAKCTGATEKVTSIVTVTAPSLSGHFNCTLQPGDGYSGGGTRTAVRALQFHLNLCSNSNLPIDGLYGPFTEAVVTYIQAANNIQADGIYGPQTRNVMPWYLNFVGAFYYCQTFTGW